MKKSDEQNFSRMKKYRSRLENAQGFSEVWEIVKDTVKTSLDERRVGMMLFLDILLFSITTVVIGSIKILRLQ